MIIGLTAPDLGCFCVPNQPGAAELRISEGLIRWSYNEWMYSLAILIKQNDCCI